MDANAKPALLGVRVADDQVRNLLQQMKNHTTSAFLNGATLENADSFMRAAGKISTHSTDELAKCCAK